MNSGLIKARISDNVLHDEDHSSFELALENGVVIHVSRLDNGIYQGQALDGMTIKQLASWTEPDETPRHPEVYCELFDPLTKIWRDCWTVEEIKEALAY